MVSLQRISMPFSKISTRIKNFRSISDNDMKHLQKFTKFARVDDKRPNLRGRPPKHFHPLLQKEKDVHSILHQILPEDIATSLSPKSLRLAHLYGLPKTHKAKLSITPILSATGTCNFNLAKWLEEKLKPFSVNEYTITDAFEFADEIRFIPMNDEGILVSYDVTALFTDVPLSETINLLADKSRIMLFRALIVILGYLCYR